METVLSLFKNSAFSVITNTLNRLGNAVIFIMIVHYLGIESGGTYTIGVSYFFIGSRFAFWGLDHLLTREVAKSRGEAARFLSNFLVVRVILATAVIILTLFIVQVLPYQNSTKIVISLMLFSIWPENINNLCWAAFAAFEEFHYTSVSVFFGSLFQILLGLWCLSLGYGVMAMAVVFFVNNLIAMLINLLILKKRYIGKWQKIEPGFIQEQLRIGLPFVFIGMFFIMDNRLDTITLSFVTTESVVGVYGAATAVITALSMIPQGYRVAILPVLARYRLQNPSQVQTLYDQSYKFLLILGLPISAATFLLADDLIQLLYREPLPTAVPTLQVISLVLLLTFLNVLNTRLLIVYDKQSLTAKFLLVTSFLNAVANIIMAPIWGAFGAGIARLVSILSLFVLNSLAVRTIVKNQTGLTLILKTILCTLVMGAVIWLMHSYGFWWQLVGGSITYLLLIVVTRTISRDEQAAVLAILRLPATFRK
ncbi:MAG: flippase [Anaerolineae bacterium]|nr:flippase [Anaerolineae bacterium]